MNPLSPEGMARSAQKMKDYAALRVDRDGPSPEIMAGAASIFERYCGGTETRSGHFGTATRSGNPMWGIVYGTATVRTPEELMAERCASIMALESYEHSLDLEAARRRANRWYRRLHRWMAIYWHFAVGSAMLGMAAVLTKLAGWVYP